MKLFAEAGKVVAYLSWLLGFARRILESAGITDEQGIVEWLKTEAGKKEAEESARSLVMKYLEAQRLAHTEVINPDLKVYLRDLYEDEVLELDETDATGTLAEAGDTFKAGVDSDFDSWGYNKPGKPAGKMLVKVREQVEDGMLAQIFGSAVGAFLKDGANPDERKRFIEEHREQLRMLCVKNDDQVINFVQKFTSKLRKDGYGTFFLREDEKTGDFFVARVDFLSDVRLNVNVFRLESDHVWYAEHRYRFVLPQLA